MQFIETHYELSWLAMSPYPHGWQAYPSGEYLSPQEHVGLIVGAGSDLTPQTGQEPLSSKYIGALQVNGIH